MEEKAPYTYSSDPFEMDCREDALERFKLSQARGQLAYYTQMAEAVLSDTRVMRIGTTPYRLAKLELDFYRRKARLWAEDVRALEAALLHPAP